MALVNWNQLWNAAREISAKPIEDEANAPVRVALVGEPKHTGAVFDRLVGARPTPEERTVAEETAPQMTDPPSDGFLTILQCGVHTSPDELANELIERLSNFRLALARRFPGLRGAICEQLVREASVTNAELAMLSAVPSVVPLAGIFLPAMADTIVLTKNQLMLLMRIAAAHGQEATWRSRLADMMPVIGGAFGWRSLARELVGVVPGGIGLGLKGMIAYTGTYVAGKAARTYYHSGRMISRGEQRLLLQEAKEQAAGVVRGLLGRIRARAASRAKQRLKSRSRRKLR